MSTVTEKDESEDDSFYRDTWKFGALLAVAIVFLYFNPDLVNEYPFPLAFVYLGGFAYFVAPIGLSLLIVAHVYPLILLAKATFWIGRLFDLDEDQVILRANGLLVLSSLSE